MSKKLYMVKYPEGEEEEAKENKSLCPFTEGSLVVSLEDGVHETVFVQLVIGRCRLCPGLERLYTLRKYLEEIPDE